MNFNPDTTKQAQEVIFKFKIKKRDSSSVNKANVTRTSSQNHWGITLDTQ